MSYGRKIRYDYKIQMSHRQPGPLHRLKPLLLLALVVLTVFAWYLWPNSEFAALRGQWIASLGGDSSPQTTTSQAGPKAQKTVEIALAPPLTATIESQPVEARQQNKPARPIPATEGAATDHTESSVSRAEQSYLQTASEEHTESIQPPEQTAPAPPPEIDWHTVTVRSGDNMAHIFKRAGLSATELYNILAIGEQTSILKRLLPGQTLKLHIDENRLQELRYIRDAARTLRVIRTEHGFEAEQIEREPESRISTSTGIIEGSLFLAGQRAGLSDNLLMQLTQIFGWDVDFVLDIRRGDRFMVIYEEQFIDGKKYRDGAILAAQFINQDRNLRAIRYTDSEGHADYFDEQGNSMRKAFLRTPVKFSRISSHFNLRRKHPVLNRIRAHKGTDYAAPKGTPVKTAGDGKIIFAGRKGGYGNTVIVQHGERYSTLYAHLNKFRSGIKKGARVSQGDTVGYVGSSGLATGPHLHYEFRVNGVHRNPLTVELPKALPIDKRYLADFKKSAQDWLLKLDVLEASQNSKQAIAVENGARKDTSSKL